MKTFNCIEEMDEYFNTKTNTYEFIEDGEPIDVEFAFNLDVNSNIMAWNIKARDIHALNIKAWDINAWNIKALDVKAWNIKALDISYYAVCFAYKNINCTSIQGTRENCKHFCLDGEIKIKGE